MKNRILLFSISFVFIVSCSKNDLSKDSEEEIDDDGAAMVVGYLPYYRFYLNDKIEYCKLTHLNLAFANPDINGNIIMPNISSVISKAKLENPNIVICISIAGGGLSSDQSSYWSNLIDIPSNRPNFISNIVDYVLANNLDGVDVDLEWSHVTSGYSDFVVELDAALNSHDKLLTVAFPQIRYNNVTDAALNAFDFINIMSYDATGPWSPLSPGQHSSFQFAADAVNFWNNTVGIPAKKLTLGVPFYGYNFISSATVTTFTYNEMVVENANNANLDQVGTSFYNGRSTIKAKVNLANTKSLGGIMIWEIGQDSYDKYSLLKTIHDEYTELGIKTTGLCGNN